MEEIRALCRYRSDQQTTIRSTTDSQFFLAGIALCYQVLGRCDKVVKDILLLGFGAPDVPSFAVL